MKNTRKGSIVDENVHRIGSKGTPDVVALEALARDILPDGDPRPPSLHGRSRVLRRLVAPTSPRAFLEEKWGQTHAHLRSSTRLAWASALVSRERLDRGLAEHRIPLASVRTLLPGEPLRQTPAPGGGSDHEVREPDRGRSLAFTSLHLYAPRLLDECIALERELRMPVRASAILSSAGAVALPHNEGTACFVVQLEGTRRWNVFRDEVVAPPRDERTRLPSPSGEPSASVVLRPGDTLYLPRGLVHESIAGKTGAIHLTFSVREVTWHDALQWLGDDALLRCSEDLFFRRSCPGHEAAWTKSDHAYLDEALTRFRQSFRLDKLEDLLEDLYLSGSISGRAEPRSSFGQLSTDVGPSTRVARNPIMFFARENVLKFANKKLIFPPKIAKAFDYVTSRERFRVSSIPTLDPRGQVVLATRLIREGFLSLDRP